MAAFVTPFSRWRSGILFRCLLSGATVVIPDSNQNWQNQLHQLAITHLSVVPTQLFRMMENDEEQFLKSMKMILLGGAAQSHGLIERAQRLGLPLRTSYGSTEMCSQVATSQPKKSRIPGPPAEKFFLTGRSNWQRMVKSWSGSITVPGVS